jgi:hypothetical protein
MSRFNAPKASTAMPTTVNVAGGSAFQMTPKAEYATALLTALCGDTYYKTGSDSINRIAELTRTIEDPLFAAKAALYTRHKGFLRTVSHVVAGELAARVKGEKWTRRFFDKVAFRTDDVTEILSYYTSKYGRKKIPNALRDGLGLALSRFDAYQLAKYRASGKDMNLWDAVNLCHPKATEALSALMKGTLAAAETWETKVSGAGKVEGDATVKAEAKKEAWTDLIKAHKLGYFAALRNLNNIIRDAPEALSEVLALLTDPRQVSRSKVMPFQFQTAMDAVKGTGHFGASIMLPLNKAVELSMANVPKFPGKTLIALDVSGSMAGKPLEIGSLMAAVLYKSQPDADVMVFSDNAVYQRSLNPGDSLDTLKASIMRGMRSGGTNFHSIFATAAKVRYDRIIILSDMQAWAGSGSGETPVNMSFKAYQRMVGHKPYLYSFNLNAVDGTMQFPESKVFALAGFTDAILQVMGQLEQDPDALIHDIESIEI